MCRAPETPSSAPRPSVTERHPQFPGRPSACSTPQRRRVLQRPLLEPGRLPWPSPSRDRLGSLLAHPRAGPLDDACSGFTHVADRTVASTPLLTRPLDHARGHRYRGPRRLPGPDSHRQAALNLSRGLRHVDLLSHGARAVWAHHPESRKAPVTVAKRAGSDVAGRLDQASGARIDSALRGPASGRRPGRGRSPFDVMKERASCRSGARGGMPAGAI